MRFDSKASGRKYLPVCPGGKAVLIVALASFIPAHDEAGAQTPLAPLERCGPNTGAIIAREAISVPAVGQERETDVGGAILSAGTMGIAETGVRLLSDATFVGRRAGGDFIVKIPAGEFAERAKQGSGPYKASNASLRYQREEKERKGLSKPDIGLYIDAADPTVLKARLNFGLSSQDYAVEGAIFELKRCSYTGTSGLRRELIYGGSAKGVLSLQYREYMDKLARPAFSQDLTFDLADGKEIGIKGARIKILSISNAGIRYIVQKPLD